MELINIQMNIGGLSYIYEPQLDITPYEVALNQMLITVSMNVKTPEMDKLAFINRYNLTRHWIRYNSQGPNICPEC